jgi:hypothetical protein
MRLHPILVLLALFAAAGALAQAYKWVDEDGVVHYSDRPEPGAQSIDLPQSKTPRRAPPAPGASREPAAPAEDAPAEPQPFSYTSLEISAPAPEETLWNIEGVLNVTLALSPALQPGHQVRVYFDGVARFVQGTSFQIEEVYRGVHNIQAEILDQNGELMIRSLPNRFYVQQNTVF